MHGKPRSSRLGRVKRFWNLGIRSRHLAFRVQGLGRRTEVLAENGRATVVAQAGNVANSWNKVLGHFKFWA